jgi:hypothetical protein
MSWVKDMNLKVVGGMWRGTYLTITEPIVLRMLTLKVPVPTVFTILHMNF